MKQSEAAARPAEHVVLAGPDEGGGMFRFRHLGNGEFTIEFLNGAEVRGAIELLRRVLGAGLHVGKGRDDVTAVYLQGMS